jgi:hypothetical protein
MNEKIRVENRNYYHRLANQYLRAWRTALGYHVEIEQGLVRNGRPEQIEGLRQDYHWFAAKARAYCGVARLHARSPHGPKEIQRLRGHAYTYRAANFLH